MLKIEIVTCEFMGPRCIELIKQVYKTALRDQDDPRVAIMWRGSAARDMVRNVSPEQWPQQWRKQCV